MKFQTSGILFLIIILVPAWACAQTYQTDNGHAEFHSSVPLHVFTGESGYLTGMIDFDENLVDFYLDLSTLKTGNSRRDRDMYRTLNIEEFPFAEFTGTLEHTLDLQSDEEQPVSVNGELTLHGITVEKRVDGTIQRQGDALLLKAEWVQDITDHNIEPPGILFYRVRDEMDVRLEARLQRRE